MLMSSFDSYTRTTVMTSSPVQLRTMLLQRAVREARQLADHIEQHDGEGILRTAGNLRSLLLELMPPHTSIADPTLITKIRSTSLYLYKAVTDASGKRDITAAREIAGLLEFEFETWQQVVARIETPGKGQTDSPGTNLAG